MTEQRITLPLKEMICPCCGAELWADYDQPLPAWELHYLSCDDCGFEVHQNKHYRTFQRLKFGREKAEQIEKEKWEHALNELEKLGRLITRKDETCIHCGAKVEQLVKNNYSTYAEPCGCRQYLGNVPEAWKNDD